MDDGWKTRPDPGDIMHKLRMIATLLNMSASDVESSELTEAQLQALAGWLDRVVAAVDEGLDLDAARPNLRVLLG